MCTMCTIEKNIKKISLLKIKYYLCETIGVVAIINLLQNLITTQLPLLVMGFIFLNYDSISI